MAELGPLRPAVAISSRAGAPVVVVADSYQYVVGYTFSPATGFQETFRKHITNDARGVLVSSPVVLREATVLSGWTQDETGLVNQGWLLFAGPHPTDWSEIVLPAPTKLGPVLTADGRIVTLSYPGVTAVRTYPRVEVSPFALPQLVQPIAPAAASRNHVFISSSNSLFTLDANALQVVARFDWQDGGARRPRSAPTGGSMRSPARRCTYSRPAACCTRARAKSRCRAAMSCSPADPSNSHVARFPCHALVVRRGLLQPGVAPK